MNAATRSQRSRHLDPVCALYESTVRHPLESTHCSCCGRPIVLGQRFVWSADGRDYCAAACADEDRFETVRVAGE